MSLNSRTSGNIQILNLEGRLDAHQAPALSAWLDENIKSNAARLVITLDKVNFVDSLALATLVKAAKRCREHEGEVHLSGITVPVRVILELTQLNKVFNIYANEAEALNAFS